MVKRMTLSLLIRCKDSDTFPARELSQGHSKKLTPATVRSESLPRMINFGQFLESMSWKKCGNLIFYCVGHVSYLIVMVLFLAHSL